MSMQSVNADTVNNPTILYEDADVLVINKPAGIIVHSDGRNVEPSVAQWVLAKYPEMEQVGEPLYINRGKPSDKYDARFTSSIIERPGIVHRLDRTTSGVMILGKTQEAFTFLKGQFQDRSTEKIYDALVYGHPKQDEGVIEAEIGRTKKKPRKWIATFAHGKKRAAITHWRVLGRYSEPDSGEPVAHLECSPKTGRTHQLRVHLKAIHHPIICDHIYAAKQPCLLGFKRPALHARSLTIDIPRGERKTFIAELPADFDAALAMLH